MARPVVRWFFWVLVVGSLVIPVVPATAMPDPDDDPLTVDLTELDPSLDELPTDGPPIYANDCHAKYWTTSTKFCVFGDPEARKVMVVLGDSHVAQWWGALTRIGWRDGYRVLWATKSVCPAPVVEVRIGLSDLKNTYCDTWRRDMVAKIANLRRVDLLVAGGFHWHRILYPGTNTVITDRSVRAAAWREGYVRLFRRVRSVVDTMVILRDTVYMRVDVPSCLAGSGGRTAPCTTTVDEGLSPRLWRAERLVDERFAHVKARSMTRYLCRSDGKCGPVASGNVVRYRDDDHLSATFVRLVWQGLRDVMSRAVLGR
jgi:hypothetical protein